MNMYHDDLLTAREAAHILGVHPNTMRRWALLGRIPVYRGAMIRFKRSDVTACLLLPKRKIHLLKRARRAATGSCCATS